MKIKGPLVWTGGKRQEGVHVHTEAVAIRLTDRDRRIGLSAVGGAQNVIVRRWRRTSVAGQ